MTFKVYGKSIGHAMWDCRYHLVWIQNIGYKVRMILSGLGEASVQPRGYPKRQKGRKFIGNFLPSQSCIMHASIA